MYKIIVICKSIQIEMKPKTVSYFLIFILTTILSCDSEEVPSLLPNVQINYVVDMNLPSNQDLLVPSGSTYIPGEGIRGIYVYNLNGSQYKAFDAACPNHNPNGVGSCATMDFVNDLWLSCFCEQYTYSILDGSPQQESNPYFAKEYRVQRVSSTTLSITNY
jgi:nitrite reductase/ring-hydroxylating ferredoxin subunit